MSDLAGITTCLLCGVSFAGPRVAIIGAHNGSGFEQLMQALGAHLKQKHPEQGQIMMQNGAAFMEWLFLGNFKTTDAELSKQRDFVRWQVHQQTIKARWPDEQVREQCAELAESLLQCVRWTDDHIDVDESAYQFTQKLIEAFTGIRETLEERGKYPSSSVVQPVLKV